MSTYQNNGFTCIANVEFWQTVSPPFPSDLELCPIKTLGETVASSVEMDDSFSQTAMADDPLIQVDTSVKHVWTLGTLP